jgi:LysR family transcriptional regulator, regulator for metE and metH
LFVFIASMIVTHHRIVCGITLRRIRQACYPLLADKPNMNVKLEIRHLRLLGAIADEGSVTGAAKRLHTTQSALSHQLRDAEERLETRLFLRLGKKMVLTPAGDHLLAAARKALEELGRAEEKVCNFNGESGGVIRLATECYTCYHWLPALLKRFHKKFARVEVLIDPDATRHPVEALLGGKLDVAILSCPPRDRNLKLTPICEDELVLTMAPDHRLADKDFVRPRDLEGETVIIYPPRSESTLLQKYMLPAGVQPKDVLEIPLTEAMIEMVASSLGVALLARWAAAPHVKTGRLAVRSLNAKGLRRTWYAATLRNQPSSQYLEIFVAMLGEPCVMGLWPGRGVS